MATAGVVAMTNYPVGCWGPPEGRLADEVLDLRLMLAPLETLPELELATPVDALSELPEVIDATLALQLDPDAPHLSFVDQLLHVLQHYLRQPGVVLRRDQCEVLKSLNEQARRRADHSRRGPS